MILLHPIWLLLFIPLLVSLWIWKLPSRLLQALRLLILLLILLAMSGLAIKLPSRVGTIIVVADRSHSMPPGSEAIQKEAIELIQAAMQEEDRLAVVSFGQTSVVERFPQSGKFTGFTHEINPDGSNLAEAMETALSLIPPGTPGRILLLSDGRWTGKSPASVASRAAAQGVAIDYRPLQRTWANDLAISHVDAPFTVTPGESFMITAWIRSPVQQEVSFELLRASMSDTSGISGMGSQRLTSRSRKVPSGLSRLTFRDMAVEPGTYQYTLRVENFGSSSEDPIPENNAAKILVGIQGPRPLLLVTMTPHSGLARILEAGGMSVKALSPEAIHWSLEDLSNFSAVLIENVPAEKIGVHGMENLVAWVKETGAGLMMTGGKDAYGPGGYFRSPLEPIMPVSMELRHEHRKLALAIVVALDRSGSMAMPVAGGRTKMDLANLAAVQVLDLLSPMDEFGVIAVDSSPHIIANLAAVENNRQVRGDILRINAQGGGIFVYEALSASARMLLSAKAGTRHIILFADAADAEEPGKYQELLEKSRQANITISVIGLGTPVDQDAELLRDIAHRGGGRSFFTDNPEELPRLFAQDTFVLARSTFLDEPTSIQLTGGLVAMTGKRFETGAHGGTPLQIGGYNLCYLRPNANLAAVTLDEYQAPVVASWQAGIGRVLAYTGEADGAYTGSIAAWKDVGDFFTSMARWTAGDSENLPGNMRLTQDIKNGVYEVQLHLDPESTISNQPSAINSMITELPKVTILRGAAGAKPIVQKTSMRWLSADTLVTEIPLHGSETVLSVVEVVGRPPLSLPPVSLPYSSEFKPMEAEEGLLTLERLARATGGKERVDLSGIWKDLPRQPRMVEIGPWLLILAIVLFLLEVLERRTGLLSMNKRSAINPQFSVQENQAASKRPNPSIDMTAPPGQKAKAGTSSMSKKQEIEEKDVSRPSDQVEKTGMLDALQQALQQARKRTERG